MPPDWPAAGLHSLPISQGILERPADERARLTSRRGRQISDSTNPHAVVGTRVNTNRPASGEPMLTTDSFRRPPDLSQADNPAVLYAKACLLIRSVLAA